MSIWTDQFLNQLSLDAEAEICKRVNCLFHRFCLAVTKGVSVYTLDDSIRGILSIAWRGRRLDAVSFEEMQYLTPATAIVSEGAGPTFPSLGVETSVSRPLYYVLHPTNIHDIRLYPCPDETFSASAENPYSPAANAASCIVGCWRNIDSSQIDPTAMLPTYIARRSQKTYVLWKAFEKDGPGQNLSAAKYYENKFDFLVDRFKAINSGAFLSKRYAVDAGLLTIDQWRYPRPILPSQFEAVRY